MVVLVAELVVPAIQEDLAWKRRFEGENEGEDLELMAPAVDPVAVEDVGRPGARGEAEVLEEDQEIPELPVQVAVDARRDSAALQSFLAAHDLLDVLGERQHRESRVLLVIAVEKLEERVPAIKIVLPIGVNAVRRLSHDLSRHPRCAPDDLPSKGVLRMRAHSERVAEP